MAEESEFIAKANSFKDEGNKELKNNNFQSAIDFYSQAIDLYPQNAIFFSNRAQANIKLENYGLAIEDASKAIEVDPNYLKSYYRRATAYTAILQYKNALADIKVVVSKQPNDKLASNLFNDLKKILKRQAFENAISVDDKDMSLIQALDFDWISMEPNISAPELNIKVEKENDQQIVNIDLTREYVEEMNRIFKNGGKIPKKHAYAIVAVANQLFLKDSSMVEIGLPINGKNHGDDEIILDGCEIITICGDTHGQYYDVLNIFEKFGQVGDKHAYLFNGDFVDRGSWSCEVAFLLYCLKILYPTRFFINRGNHETNDMNKVYGFEGECKYKYSEKLFKLFAESFNSLPFATLIGSQYLVMHGGLFSKDDVKIADIKKINRLPNKQPPKEGLEMELLWTDPQPENGRSPSKRGIGMQFGPDITKKFCELNNLKCVIRSHEVRMGGYEVEHDGKLVTVFSAPNYCDSQGNLGAVVNLKLKPNGSEYDMTFETFQAVPHPDIKPMAYNNTSFGY